MNVDTDMMGWQDLPAFLSCAEKLKERLQGMTYDELKALWKCSDKLAQENFERLRGMDLRESGRLTPAILAYEGIQYQYMAPGVFSGTELDYVQEHLRILSGFYGVLRPFDGVTPYRLEMQAKLAMDHGAAACIAGDLNESGGETAGGGYGSGAAVKDLYGFWGSLLADTLAVETDCVLNLASKEYSFAVSKHLPDSVRFITCVFGEEKNGKIVEKGTLCKMARGEMVRRMAENDVREPEAVKELQLLNYSYSEEHSDDETYVFLLKE